MNQQSNLYFKTIQEFVYKNLRSKGISIKLGRKDADFQTNDMLFFKLEVLKIIFDKVNLYSSNLNTEKLSDSKKVLFQDLQELVLFPFEDSVSNTKFSEILKNSKHGLVYSFYDEQVYKKFKVFYSGESKTMKLSAFPEITDFVKNLSFDILFSKIKEMSILDGFLNLSHPRILVPRKNTVVSNVLKSGMFQRQK